MTKQSLPPGVHPSGCPEVHPLGCIFLPAKAGALSSSLLPGAHASVCLGAHTSGCIYREHALQCASLPTKVGAPSGDRPARLPIPQGRIVAASLHCTRTRRGDRPVAPTHSQHCRPKSAPPVLAKVDAPSGGALGVGTFCSGEHTLSRAPSFSLHLLRGESKGLFSLRHCCWLNAEGWQPQNLLQGHWL